MMPKYTIDYAVRKGQHAHARHFSTDDPVACEEFLVDLLEQDGRIEAIKHDGLALPTVEFDRMIRTAGGMLAARHVCRALDITPEEERFRFGFAA